MTADSHKGQIADAMKLKGEPYNASSLVRTYGITRDQTRRLIAKIGDNREKLEKAAETLAQRGKYLITP